MSHKQDSGQVESHGETVRVHDWQVDPKSKVLGIIEKKKKVLFKLNKTETSRKYTLVQKRVYFRFA